MSDSHLGDLLGGLPEDHSMAVIEHQELCAVQSSGDPERSESVVHLDVRESLRGEIEHNCSPDRESDEHVA